MSTVSAVLYRVAYVCLALLFVADALTTRLALTAGAYEANPLIAPLLRTPAGWLIALLVKALGWSLVVVLARLTQRVSGQRISAQIFLPMLLAACVGMAFIVTHNWLVFQALAHAR